MFDASRPWGAFWDWNIEAERTYEEVVEHGGRVADAMRAFRTLLGGSDMIAYLAMMAKLLPAIIRPARAADWSTISA
jgi:hypothetical protein